MHIRTLILSCLLPCLAVGQKSMLVNPGKLFFQQRGNTPETKTVTITNQSDAPISIRCTFADWKRDSVGSKIYYPPGTIQHSNAKYIKVNPQFITIGPKEARNVEVTLMVPDSLANRTTNAMLFITQFEENRSVEKSKELKQLININLEIGVHVYNEPPNLQRKDVDITGLSFRPEKDSTTSGQMVIRYRNSGELVAAGDIRVELTDASGKEYKLKTDQFNSLPGDEMLMKYKLPLLNKGKYQVVTILDLGNDLPLKIAEKELEIK